MKKFIPLFFIIALVATGCSMDFGALSSDDKEWKDFTDNLETIEYSKMGIKDAKGIWKPTQEDFKEIYKYTYGYDLVAWQKMDGTEMCPLQEKGRGRVPCIPQWEQEWNNNVERGEFNKDILTELRKDIRQGMVNSNINELESISKKQKKNYFTWLKKIIKKVYAGVEFSDTFTDSNFTNLVDHTPNTGTGWTQIIATGTCSPTPCTMSIVSNQVTPITTTASEGALDETDDVMSGADYTVKIDQANGDSLDDTNSICCRIQDANNMYCVRFNESASDLYERVGGSWSTIDTNGGAIADGSKVELICSGTSITVEDDDSEILSATDSSHSSAGKAGIGAGAIMESGDDASSQLLDDFSVNVSAEEPPIDTCTPPVAGDWYLDSDDNCFVNTETFIAGDVYLVDTGAGAFNLTADLNCQNFYQATSTTVNYKHGAKINSKN